MTPKNPAAQALAKLRAEKLTPERRFEISKLGNAAKKKKAQAKQRKRRHPKNSP
jgi:hypothetical protein